MSRKNSIALVGGGPSALFVYKRIVEAREKDLRVEIFERGDHLGQGMPYSSEGANLEHITNVSGNELPDLVTPLADWVKGLPQDLLDRYQVDGKRFDEERVLPRLLFGRYLESQFQLLLQQAHDQGLETLVHYQSPVIDLIDHPKDHRMEVVTAEKSDFFDRVVVCSGHNWPKSHEGKVEGYFDSPYPPAKLAKTFDHAVALRGSSLTAIDAIRTLARANGTFRRSSPDTLNFEAAPGSEDFKLVMHTRSGLLPCVRFHLEEPQVSDDRVLPKKEWERALEENEGFVPLDFIFEHDFKKILKDKDPALYQKIKAMKLEEFVELAMSRRERAEPFDYFKAEYLEALESLARRESIPWKEVLAILSFALNYPAKHFSAEDMLRMRHVLMPLISIVIAFIPKESCEELLALHEAGRLTLVPVGSDSDVEAASAGGIIYHHVDESGEKHSVCYETFVDCIGQPHLPVKAFPFCSLIEQKAVRQARLRFRSAEGAQEQQKKDPDSVEKDPDGTYHLIVPGIAINDSFQPVNWEGKANPRLHIMAVPYIGGHNPDYSGVDFCEEASALIVGAILDPARGAKFSA